MPAARAQNANALEMSVNAAYILTMKTSILPVTLALFGCAGPALSQTAPIAPVTDTTPQIEVRRAIIVEPAPVVSIDDLPRTLPPEVKRVYTECQVPGNVIAITFDDGPHPQNTPRLLDLLKERGIKATFFLIGKSAATWPDIVRRIVAEGHEIGNHTWSHPQLTSLKESRVLSELQATHDAIVKACGVAPLLYRPPYGATRLSQQKLIHDHFQYPAIMWDVDPLDWQQPRTVAKVHDRVLARTHSGSIILCHDIHEPTVDAMPSTLDDLMAKGFHFVTVTQLINLEARSVPPPPVAATTSAPADSRALPVPASSVPPAH